MEKKFKMLKNTLIYRYNATFSSNRNFSTSKQRSVEKDPFSHASNIWTLIHPQYLYVINFSIPSSSVLYY